MTDIPAGAPRTRASTVRAAAVLVAWLVAALVAGIPDDATATGTAKASSATTQTPVVQNTGPECFAGHAPAPASSKSRD